MPDPLTQSRLKQLVEYDSESGLLISNGGSGRRKAGSAVGNYGEEYVRVKIDGVSYRAHRLIWFYMKGEWPKHHIDHINGRKHDNRLQNLREVTHQQNLLLERKTRSDSKSGKIGVQKIHGNKYRVTITVNKIKHHLGVFASLEDAAKAYEKAKENIRIDINESIRRC